jgi:CP family cyanate transporter-like MFS transporter
VRTVSSTARPVVAPAPAVPLAIVAGLFIASLALRPQVLAIGPLQPFIREDLGLPASIAGLLTTIPVLCMGIFAPVGPRLAARLGPRLAFAASLGLIAGFGIVRTVAPTVPLLLLATVAIGVGIGVAGAIPSMIVSGRLPSRPVLGTGAYAAGIVTGSSLAAALAVPLAIDGQWRLSLLLLSVASLLSILVWLLLSRGGDGGRPRTPTRALHLPWRSGTGWLLVLVFGLQSVMFYGVVTWLPEAYVERGWGTLEAGALVAVFNGIGLFTTIGVPLVADRLGERRPQLLVAAVIGTVALIGIILVPDPAFLWVAILGLALGTVFPLALTLPIDVADDPARVGSVAALMLLGGYILSSVGPVVLGAARDVTGDFTASLWLLVVVGVLLVAACALLSPERLRQGIGRA